MELLEESFLYNKYICKICIFKAHKYQIEISKEKPNKMKEATLDNYKRKIKVYCGALMAKDVK